MFVMASTKKQAKQTFISTLVNRFPSVTNICSIIVIPKPFPQKHVVPSTCGISPQENKTTAAKTSDCQFPSETNQHPRQESRLLSVVGEGAWESK